MRERERLTVADREVDRDNDREVGREIVRERER